MTHDTLTFNGRLPGVLCETSVPANPANPLRLDVAGFVGFTERGPIDLPVLVEDLSQYRLIFGGDLVLAAHQGLPVYAHLPRAVEAFFGATRPCGPTGIGGCDAFMKLCLSSSGCESRPAKGEPARVGSKPCASSRNGVGDA